jgi:hypothetical protein
VPVEQETKAIPEAVGIFHRSEELQAAIDELLSSDFHRSELSLLAGALMVEEKLGHLYKGVSPLAVTLQYLDLPMSRPRLSETPRAG